jgi:hypothetical protein
MPEAAAANLAARFEAVVDGQQLAPVGHPRGLALQQPPEHDAVAAQQRHGDVLQRFRIGARLAGGGALRATAGGRRRHRPGG